VALKCIYIYIYICVCVYVFVGYCICTSMLQLRKNLSDLTNFKIFMHIVTYVLNNVF
jgi:hypothetical protein